MYDLGELLSDDARRHALRRSVDPRSADAATRGPLLDAKIKITSRCNLRCTMCHYWHTKREQKLDTDAWQRVLDELAALGCRKVHFSGGEPFLRADLLDILEHGIGAGLKINITTNGTLLGKDDAKRMAAMKLNAVSISLDGPTAKLHDQIRGRPGAFKQSVRALRWLKKAQRRGRPRLRINVVVMRDNYRRLPELLRLAGDIGVDDVVPMPVDESFNGTRRLSKLHIARYNEEIAPQMLALRKAYDFDASPERVFIFGTTDRDIKRASRGDYARGYHRRMLCLAPWLHVFIAWDGHVYLCCMTTAMMDPLGNVRQSPLEAILEGTRYTRTRRRFLSGEPTPQCHRCDLFVRENRQLADALALAPIKSRRLSIVR